MERKKQISATARKAVQMKEQREKTGSETDRGETSLVSYTR